MDNNETVDYLIMNGAIEVAGIDSETGQFLYSFTPKIKEIMPDLYHQHLNHVNGELMRLWEKGFIDIDFFSPEPIVTVTDKAFDKEALSSLSKDDQWSIDEIKRLMKRPEL